MKNDKCFVVMTGDNDDRRTVRVFTYKVDAEAWIGKLSNVYDIEELPLDDHDDRPVPEMFGWIARDSEACHFDYVEKTPSEYYGAQRTMLSPMNYWGPATNNVHAIVLQVLFDHIDEEKAKEFLRGKKEELLRKFDKEVIRTPFVYGLDDLRQFATWQEAWHYWDAKRKETPP